MADAVAAVVRRAEHDERKIVGWSLFERTVVQKAALPTDLKESFTARYVNGRALASRWKSTLYPGNILETEGPFDPRNRLDRFAVLTGYEHPEALEGRPAAWLRRVSGQMRQKNGRYGAITKQARQDWRSLLAYNEHDCRALRHIVGRAAFDLEKWAEYRLMRFCVSDDARRRFCFSIGATSRELEALLDRCGADRWAFITAWNPRSTRLSREENDRRQSELLAHLVDYRILAGEGVGRDVTSPREPSLLVLGIRRKEAVRLGRRFGQLAIVAGHKGYPARLVPCSPLPKLT